MNSIISFIGADWCGKTCVIERYLTKGTGQFEPRYLPTTYVCYSPTPELEIRDIGGNEKYTSVTLSYCSNADIVVYCVALNDALDSKAISQKIEWLRGRLAPKTIFYLVGTKSDLPREISNDTIQALADSIGCRCFITSAKDGSGIDDLFSELTQPEPQENASEGSLKAPTKELRSNLLIALEKVQAAINLLYDTEKGRLLHQETAKLISSLKNGTLGLDNKGAAIQAYHDECYRHLGLITSPNLKKIAALVTFVAITAIVTLIVAAIGFGLGFAAGAWVGPGAFITGAFGGVSAATAVISVAGTVGGLVGLKGTTAFFKPTPIAISVNNVCNAIEEYTGNMADIPSMGNLNGRTHVDLV